MKFNNVTMVTHHLLKNEYLQQLILGRFQVLKVH